MTQRGPLTAKNRQKEKIMINSITRQVYDLRTYFYKISLVGRCRRRLTFLVTSDVISSFLRFKDNLKINKKILIPFLAII